jgi:hypothetical protein
MAIVRVLDQKYAWSFTQKFGYFKIRTQEYGWVEPMKVSSADTIATIGALVQGGNVWWDTDAGAIISAGEETAFRDFAATKSRKSRGGDPPFPGPVKPARVL